MSQEPAPTRRTKRRYAHELFPHPDECEVRPLAVEVPYLYARAIGATSRRTSSSTFSRSMRRTSASSSAPTSTLVDRGVRGGRTG